MTDLSGLRTGDRLLVDSAHGDRLCVVKVAKVFKHHLRDDAGQDWAFDGTIHDRVGRAHRLAIPFDTPEGIEKLAAWEDENEIKRRRVEAEAEANARRLAFRDVSRRIGDNFASVLAKVLCGLGTGDRELTDAGIAEMKAIVNILETRGKL